MIFLCTNEGRSSGDVMTTFSRLHGLPIFLTNVASRAEASLWLPTQTDFALEERTVSHFSPEMTRSIWGPADPASQFSQMESVLWLPQPSSPWFSYFNFYGITKFEIWEKNKKRRAISGGCRPMSQSWKFLIREAKSNVDFEFGGEGGLTGKPT